MYLRSVLFALSVHVTASIETIWENPMSSVSSSWSGSVSYTVASSGCPGGQAYCYHLTDVGYIEYTAPTNNPPFQNVRLSYSLSAASMSANGGDQCSILYSVNNGVSWTTIQQTTVDTDISTTRTLSNPSADNVASLRIRLAHAGNKNHECYYNSFALTGDAITDSPTSDPSSSPTTSSPTKVSTIPTVPPTVTRASSPSSAPTKANIIPFNADFSSNGYIAQVTRLTMSASGVTTTLSTGDAVSFTSPPAGTSVTITMYYTATRPSNIYCPGCVRQILFRADDVTRDCNTLESGSSTLSFTYTSTGDYKALYTGTDLQYRCSDSTKLAPWYIGYIGSHATANPTTATVPPTTSAPTVNTVAPTRAPSQPPTESPSKAPSKAPEPTTSTESPDLLNLPIYVYVVIGIVALCLCICCCKSGNKGKKYQKASSDWTGNQVEAARVHVTVPSVPAPVTQQALPIMYVNSLEMAQPQIVHMQAPSDIPSVPSAPTEEMQPPPYASVASAPAEDTPPPPYVPEGGAPVTNL